MIVASVVVVVQRGFASGLPAIRAAQKDRAALACARSVLTSAGNTTTLAAGQSETGSCNDIDWSMDTTAFQFADGDHPAPPVAGVWVDVTVKWRNSSAAPAKSMHLRTLKIGRQG